MYCVYITALCVENNILKYVGSSSIKKIEEGYHGSVSSKQYKTLWESLLQSSPDAFKTEIYSIHKTRKEALEAELLFQIENDVVKSSEWINMSLARPNGFFGMDVSGDKNPMYGKSRKGETHKGGENISNALRKFFDSDLSTNHREKSSQRMKENNPAKNTEIMQKIKLKWKHNQRNVGDNNPMYGKTHTEDARKKMSEKAKGRPAPNKGKVMSEDQKEKLRKPKSEEHKAKLRYTYIVNGILVHNAKQYCKENNFNYIRFTQAAKLNKSYKGNSVSVLLD